MENINLRRRRKDNSGDMFSFPVFPLVEDHDGSGSCASDNLGLSPNSPADHLFSNGRLLPHSFPCQPTTTNTYSFSRSTSITSSVSSKDSFLSSSRSNSSNSRSSSCSSARTSTSTSEAAMLLSERKLFMADQPRVSSDRYRAKKPVLMSSSSSPHYGSSRRWQFIMPAPPPPILKHHHHHHHHHNQQGVKGGSRTRKVVAHNHETDERENLKYKKKAKKIDWAGRWFGWTFFRSFVSACKKCHAMNPSPRKYPPC